MQNSYGETHRQRVMERVMGDVLGMCWGNVLKMGCFVHRFLISGPDLRITAGFCLGMVSPATGIEDAGGDWYHEGGIILSKKPPEWHLSPPLHEFRVRFKFLCSKGEWPACSVHGGNGLPHPILIFVTAKKNGPPATTSLLHGRMARRQNDRCGCRRGQDATKAA